MTSKHPKRGVAGLFMANLMGASALPLGGASAQPAARNASACRAVPSVFSRRFPECA